MSGAEGASWRFLPADAETPDEFHAALSEGPAALSRAIRACRATIGAARTASRLRDLRDRPAASLRLLLAAPIQPQALVDALQVAFAAIGLRVAIESVEGFAALEQRLAQVAQRSDEPEMILLVDPSPSAEPDPVFAGLAGEAAMRLGVPAALARFGSSLGETAVATGADLLTVGIPLDAAIDRRFAASFGTILRPAAADALADAVAAWAARRTGRAPKLLVTDLDGTVWNGVLGERSAADEDSSTTPPMNVAYAETLRTLSSRGFVLAIASRNEPADVDAALKGETIGPLDRTDFAAVAIGWEDKAALVARVLVELGLGAEHTVFVDDDPVNCAKVAARFPEMDVRLFAGDPDTFAAALLADPLLLGGGAEAGFRAERYRAKAGVERLRAETPDVASFLAALDTRLTFQPLDALNVTRAVELASRVNQFVLRNLRPNALDLAARRSFFDTLVRLDDAFGSHGIVGLMLASAEGDALVLDNLYLSCRALERGVEDAMLASLAAGARAAGLARLTGRLELLPRNAPAQAFVGRVARVAADGCFDYPLGEAGAPFEGGLRVGWQDSPAVERQGGKGDQA